MMWSLRLLVGGCSARSGSSCNCWFDFVWSVFVAWDALGFSVVGMFFSFSGFNNSACSWIFWFVGDVSGFDVGVVMN